MSENHFNISLHITDWNCDSCGTYCKPTGIIKKEFIDTKVEHMCMNPTCGNKIMLETHYPKWDELMKAISNNRGK